jgi:hypothetical protein
LDEEWVEKIFDGFPIADFRVPIEQRDLVEHAQSTINKWQSKISLGLILAQSLIQRFANHLRNGLRGIHDHPLHLSSTDLILGDAAGFAGTGFHDRRRSTLELASAAGGD